MKFIFSKYFLIALIIVLLVFFAISFFLQSGSTKPGTTSPSGQPIIPIPFFNPQPTAVKPQPLSIIQTEPTDNQQNFPLSLAITVTFSRPVGDSEKQNIRLGLSPQASGSGSWSQDNTQFIFTPQGLLTPNASYEATLLYETKSKTWSFTTAGPEPTIDPAIKQGLDTQSTYDEQWAKKQQDLYQNYPWYDQLPLSTADYFVSFDSQTLVIYADLFPKDPTNVLEINKIKQEVLDALAGLNVNTTTVTVQWQVQQSQ